jgi:hypothetical protein
MLDSVEPNVAVSCATGYELSMSDTSVEVSVEGPTRVIVYPPNYFDYPSLCLFFKNSKSFSVDQVGAAKHKVTANTPSNYVKQLQADLIKLKYLAAGKDDGAYSGSTARAVKRFQRYAKRVYRMPGPADVSAAEVFSGAATGECDQATAQEIQKWVTEGWVLPVGRIPLREISVPGVAAGRLREDAADEWEAIVALVQGAGGTLSGPYGDTQRNVSRAIAANSAGASSFSFHYCGRAVDINQGFAGGRNMRLLHRHDCAN